MKEVIQEYKNLRNMISVLITKSGYKNSFLAEKIGMPAPNFSVKKQKGTWTENEMEKILDIIENEELEDFYLLEVMKQRKNDEVVSLEQFKKEMGWL